MGSVIKKRRKRMSKKKHRKRFVVPEYSAGNSVNKQYLLMPAAPSGVAGIDVFQGRGDVSQGEMCRPSHCLGGLS